MGFRAEASLGYFDATYPGTATITLAGTEKLTPGQPLSIGTSWDLDPCARITSNGSPTIDAGVTIELTGKHGSKIDAEANIELQAFGETIVDEEIIDIDFDFAAAAFLPIQSCWNHPAVVQDQQITRPQPSANIPKLTVADFAGHTIETQQPARVTIGSRSLCNERIG